MRELCKRTVRFSWACAGFRRRLLLIDQASTFTSLCSGCSSDYHVKAENSSDYHVIAE